MKNIPKSINTVSYIQDHLLGCVSENQDELIDSLLILKNREFREVCSLNALSLAEKEHLKTSVHRKHHS